MPTFPDTSLTDRFYEFVLGKPSRRERALLAAAIPPVWVRLTFVLIFSVLAVALLISVFGQWIPVNWRPPLWPAWSFVAILIPVTQFVKREVYRQYGKRALRGQQGHV